MRHPTRHYEWERGPGLPTVRDVTTTRTGWGAECGTMHQHGWTCTRRPGHTQRHAAGDGIHVQAVWG